jgi:signal transduction histidine kinase
LAIAKKITNAYEGHIEVSSVIGKGTVFTAVLPAA